MQVNWVSPRFRGGSAEIFVKLLVKFSRDRAHPRPFLWVTLASFIVLQMFLDWSTHVRPIEATFTRERILYGTKNDHQWVMHDILRWLSESDEIWDTNRFFHLWTTLHPIVTNWNSMESWPILYKRIVFNFFLKFYPPISL